MNTLIIFFSLFFNFQIILAQENKTSHEAKDELQGAIKNQDNTDINLLKDQLNQKFEFFEGNKKDLKIEVDLDYNPDYFRDPFSLPERFKQSPIVPKTLIPNELNEEKDLGYQPDLNNPYTGYFINDYKIKAILWDVEKPKVILVTPKEELLTASIGYRIGREGLVIWKIKEKEIIFLSTYDGFLKKGSTLIMKFKP